MQADAFPLRDETDTLAGRTKNARMCTATLKLSMPAVVDREDNKVNTAYAAWFLGRLPSRTCVGVSGLAVGALVEIDWVCWRSDGWGSTLGS